MVSDDVRERLYALALERVHAEGWGRFSETIKGVVATTVDALVESKEVADAWAYMDAATERDMWEARADELREALEEAKRYLPGSPGAAFNVIQRTLDGEPVAVPDRPEGSR